MSHRIGRWLWVAPLCLLAGLLWSARRPSRSADMTRAAQAFLNVLDAKQKERVQLKFEDAYRKDWHYVPRERRGLPLADMTAEQRGWLKRLLKTALSEEGMQKADGVVQLEAILREMESKPGAPALGRDPERYTLTIFGAPAEDRAWGWRYEGHHLSLNFSSVTSDLVATTPMFFGANPAEVKTGSHGGLRVLAKEEDLARELALGLSDEQRAIACPQIDVPSDIILGAGRAASFQRPPGITGADLSAEQRAQLMRIVELYANDLQDELAEQALAPIRADGVEKLCFVWLGELEPGKPHYWRIQSKLFAIELDDTQDNANHVHTVWRDFKNDFGEDFLREHYEDEHAKK